MSFDWKALLGQVAPVLGTAILGPFGSLAGIAIKTALGLASDSPDEAMHVALANATPDQLKAIQDADHQFKLDMERLNIDLAKIDADDRASAREREANVKDHTPTILAVIVTSGFFGLLGWMMACSPAEGSETVLNIMVGALGAAWASIVAYYFGSSAGSARKDTLLLNASPRGGK